jgi:hypothetical protein
MTILIEGVGTLLHVGSKKKLENPQGIVPYGFALGGVERGKEKFLHPETAI